MAQEIGVLLSRAYAGGVDVSLDELIGTLSALVSFQPDDLLGNAALIQSCLGTYHLQLDPSITTGNYQTRRLLRPIVQSSSTTSLDQLIADGEHGQLEFKGSLYCNLDRLAHSQTYHKSDDVIQSCLKTIAAFGNSDGGILLVGIRDNGEVSGIENDFATIGKDRDGWENDFRSLIGSRFRDGQIVNSFVDIQYVTHSGKTVAKVNCIKRKDAVFLRHPREPRHEFYIRQGNRSTCLDLPDIWQLYRVSAS